MEKTRVEKNKKRLRRRANIEERKPRERCNVREYS
jgi:hypothetical protein